MLKKPLVILISLGLAVVGAWLYFEFRTPTDVEGKGDEGSTIAVLVGIGGIVSLLTAIVGLVQKLLELRTAGKP